MKIAFGCDHVALEMKSQIKDHILSKGFDVLDFGTFTDEVCNYPVYGIKVAKAIATGEADLGILICGTGVGISLAANRIPGIRAVVCSEPYTAMISRRHNDTNILAFGARVIGVELAKMIVDQWLEAEFEGGRHKVRVDMIENANAEYDS